MAEGDLGRPGAARHGLVGIVDAEGPDVGSSGAEPDRRRVAARQRQFEALTVPGVAWQTLSYAALCPAQHLASGLAGNRVGVLARNPSGDAQHLVFADDARHTAREV